MGLIFFYANLSFFLPKRNKIKDIDYHEYRMENCSAMTEILPISRLRQSRQHKLNLNPFTVYSLVDAQRYLEKNSRFLSILHP